MRPLFHRHHWRAVNVQHGQFTVVRGDGTTVLYHCDGCGNNKTESINGHWTLDDLNGSRVGR